MHYVYIKLYIIHFYGPTQGSHVLAAYIKILNTDMLYVEGFNCYWVLTIFFSLVLLPCIKVAETLVSALLTVAKVVFGNCKMSKVRNSATEWIRRNIVYTSLSRCVINFYRFIFYILKCLSKLTNMSKYKYFK